MRRSTSVLLMVVLVVGCQATEPRPSPVAQAPTSPMPTLTSAPQPTPVPTPRRISPFSGESFGEAVLDETVDVFIAALATLYRDPNRGLLDRTFSAEGLDSARAYDWRLRGAVSGQTRHFGDLSVRGKAVYAEQTTADPPFFNTDISIAIAPGAELVDARSRALLQGWTERQLYDLGVRFEYDVADSLWMAVSVGPADPTFGNPPPTPAPPVRCKGLGRDRPDDTDPSRSRTWCIGGREGILATDEIVVVWDEYPCGESRASVMTVGWPIGSPIDGWARYHYVRDPDGRFKRSNRLPVEYLPNTRLPTDAYSTGLTDGEFEIWVSPSMGADAIWARRTSKVERWPRVTNPFLVIDCN